MTNAPRNPEYVTDTQLCELLQVDMRTTLRWRDDGTGRPYVRAGPRRILYRRADVDAWLAARTFPHRAAEAVRTTAQIEATPARAAPRQRVVKSQAGTAISRD